MEYSNKCPSVATVARIRKSYPKGCRVELVYMGEDPYSRLRPGDRGTVSFVDDTGNIFVNWDCGSGLGMIYGVDRIQKI